METLNKQAIKFVEFGVCTKSNYPRYFMDVYWYNGNKFSFNIYDSDFNCQRLKYLCGARVKLNDFFSQETLDEVNSKVWNMLGKDMGVVESQKGW